MERVYTWFIAQRMGCFRRCEGPSLVLSSCVSRPSGLAREWSLGCDYCFNNSF